MQRGFISIPILIVSILAATMVITGSYVAVIKYQNYKKEQISEKTRLEELIKTQSKSIEETKKEIIKLKSESKTELIQPLAQKFTISDAIKKWESAIFQITCEITDYKNRLLFSSGSGLGFNLNDGSVFFTNRHVVYPDEASGIKECLIYKRGVSPTKLNLNNLRINNKIDFGHIINKVIDPNFSHIFGGSTFCKKDSAKLGDEIIILGYPVIGSQNDITVTDGIISGIEEDFFVTSAKIDHGNSGGAAILLKNNCFLGIPTFVLIGDIEALGRILKAEKIVFD